MKVEEAAAAGPLLCFSRRREKTPEKRTGEVRPAPASRAGNQACEPRRRETRARARPQARTRLRAIQGPRPGREDGSAEGTKRKERKGRRNGGT